ncbi:hypothetical protein CRUP_019048 [Coryphaenoides rupestris]|nr:hypothetical protein CRUP_019048 [Coryphaenoides rupestris]
MSNLRTLARLARIPRMRSGDSVLQENSSRFITPFIPSTTRYTNRNPNTMTNSRRVLRIWLRRSASNWKLLVAAGGKASVWSGEGMRPVEVEAVVEAEVEAEVVAEVEAEVVATGASERRVGVSEISSIFRILALGDVESGEARSPPAGSWPGAEDDAEEWLLWRGGRPEGPPPRAPTSRRTSPPTSSMSTLLRGFCQQRGSIGSTAAGASSGGLAGPGPSVP